MNDLPDMCYICGGNLINGDCPEHPVNKATLKPVTSAKTVDTNRGAGVPTACPLSTVHLGNPMDEANKARIAKADWSKK